MEGKMIKIFEGGENYLLWLDNEGISLVDL